MSDRSRLNVLFITSWYPTKGVPIAGIFIREHAKAVQRYDNVVVLHCAGVENGARHWWRIEAETDETLKESVSTWRVFHRRLAIPKVSYLLFLWSVYQAFRYVVAGGFRPDLIHGHIYAAGAAAVLLGKLYHIPVVVTEHSSAFPRRLLTNERIWQARLAFQWADRVLPVSNALRKAIEAYGIRARFEIVPNVADTALFSRRPEGRQDASRKRILFVGMLSAIKGIPYLLEALAQLRQKRADWQLDVVGDGPEREKYEQLVTSSQLGDKVAFHGQKPKEAVAEFMHKADLFVLPSLWENSPCVLAEAMACGLPIVSTCTGGIPEMVDEQVGILAPPGDPAALAFALEKMLDSLGRFDSALIANKGARYSPESIGRRLHSIYASCVS